MLLIFFFFLSIVLKCVNKSGRRFCSLVCNDADADADVAVGVAVDGAVDGAVDT